MPEIIMTCGTICCGKSTYAKKIQTVIKNTGGILPPAVSRNSSFIILH